MKTMTKNEYNDIFEKWLYYQFPRSEDDWNNFYILKTVAKIVSDDDELQHWANRDNWSMLDYAKSELKATA
jgi:hypothetical protein